MKLLAIDTSTEFLSLALQVGERTFTHYQHAGVATSTLVLPQISALLDSANCTLHNLNGIAFGAGPGAFTGVRIACGVAQGLGFGSDLPVVGINTLLALAQASGEDKVIACLDARMGEIYHAAYVNQNGIWQEASACIVCKPEAAPVLVGGGWVGVGSGWRLYADALSKIYAQNQNKVLAQVAPTAEVILQLARPVFEAGEAKPAIEARPIYIRNRVALTTQQREQGQQL